MTLVASKCDFSTTKYHSIAGKSLKLMSYEQHFLAGKWPRIKHGQSQNKIQVHIQVDVLRACRGSSRCM